ncbi:putative 5' nucleotidase [Acanthamoeba polyphaga moumouvirus]|uniref:Putative 5' nucleotidase n=1 Tax=Acanthamoeba polyphaga moumouvirus TaxID=1269028 RepID=L7RDR4_9VIRU|nr:putative 5' nucleotidase [Acanthamoeba polyphaga moumouvirus]AGC02426.1 putative 5' nucleotidase [Acanthamoeba polyphaga moumouvirus]
MESYTLTKKVIKLGISFESVLFDIDSKIMDEFKKNSMEFTSFEEMYEKICDDTKIKEFYYDKIHPNIYSNLKPISGAVEAFQYLSNVRDHQSDLIFKIFVICKSSKNNPNHFSDKINCVRNEFGLETVKNIIFVKDKTMLNLDILIDNLKFVRGINGSSIHIVDQETRFYPDRLHFQHIRFNTQSIDTHSNYPIINSWIVNNDDLTNSYKEIILNNCLKLGLLTKNIELMPDINLTVCSITGNKYKMTTKPSILVIDFKRCIESMVNLSSNQQRICVNQNNKSFIIGYGDDNLSLYETGVINNAKIYVVYRAPSCSHC